MKTTLRQQLEAFENGVFLDSDGQEDTGCFVFYDWFCKDSSLKRKATGLFKKTKMFAKMKDVDLAPTYSLKTIVQLVVHYMTTSEYVISNLETCYIQ